MMSNGRPISADNGAKAFDDEFIFADGQFTSKAMLAHGFKTGPYRFETEGDDVEWSADLGRQRREGVRRRVHLRRWPVHVEGDASSRVQDRAVPIRDRRG